jgi:hypothetical protein
MPDGRETIPAKLVRNLMIEAGHRCAIPTCHTTEPLQIEHIEEYAQVQEHTFENMIVLCANCHARKKNNANPRHIDRTALRQYKANLGLLNARYGDFERRVIDWFARHPDVPFIQLGGVGVELEIQLMYLLQDGMLIRPIASTADGNVPDIFGGVIRVSETFVITEKGRNLVERWKAARPIDPNTAEDTP